MGEKKSQAQNYPHSDTLSRSRMQPGSLRGEKRHSVAGLGPFQHAMDLSVPRHTLEQMNLKINNNKKWVITS